MPHIIAAVVENRPGVLHRTVTLLRRRGYNIESLTVGPSEQPGASRMTLVVEADDVTQVVKQLYRLVEVLQVTDVTNVATVEREAALLRVAAAGRAVRSVRQVAARFGARIADRAPGMLLLEVSGAPSAVDGLIAELQPFGIRELTRTGRIAMTRVAMTHTAAPPPSGPDGADTDHSPFPWHFQADGIS